MFAALGCQVAHTQDAQAARRRVIDDCPSVFVVDSRIEDAAGLCSLGSGSGALVVLLADSKSHSDQVKALDAGADDLIARPVVPDVLEAKARAMIRRIRAPGRHGPLGHSRTGWAVDITRRAAVSPDGTRVTLAYQQALLFDLLISSGSSVVTAQQVVATPGFENLSEDGVRVSMSRLRRRLLSIDEDPPIRTVYGVGYAYAPRVPRGRAEEPADAELDAKRAGDHYSLRGGEGQPVEARTL